MRQGATRAVMTGSKCRSVLVGVAVMAGLVALPASTAGATTSVTLYVDATGQASTGCTSAGTGACSTMSEGLAAASLLSGDIVTIDVAASATPYATNIDISTGSPTLIIDGAGAGSTVLDGGGSTVGEETIIAGYDTEVTIENVTIENGYNASSYGGNIIAEGSLDLNNDTISGGYAGDGGGALYVTNQTTLEHDTFTGNSGYYAGAISDYGTLTATDTTFSSNSSSYSGAIFVQTGKSLTASDDTFSHNAASASGGAIFTHGTATLYNDTFDANTAGSGEGGAVFSNDQAAVTTMTFDTLYDNTAPAYGGGVFNYADTSFTISDSIFENSTCAYESGNPHLITDGGYNIDSDQTCGFDLSSDKILSSTINLVSTLTGATSSVPGDLPLGNGSSAADVIPAADCTGNYADDEQGLARVTGAATTCSAGASALVEAPVIVKTVPSAPRSPKATAANASIKLSWTAPSSTGGDPLTIYRVYCSKTKPVSTKGKDTLTVKSTVRSVTVPKLTNGVHYTCVVTAVNAIGSSAASPNASATPKK